MAEAIHVKSSVSSERPTRLEARMTNEEFVAHVQKTCAKLGVRIEDESHGEWQQFYLWPPSGQAWKKRFLYDTDKRVLMWSMAYQSSVAYARHVFDDYISLGLEAVGREEEDF